MSNNRQKSHKQPIHGVLLLDKPQGPSSNQALQAVKGIFRAAKAGHTGSLDPLATGLLPICFGEATKISAFLLGADKCYRVRCRLGIRTTTADAEGDVLEERDVPDLSDDMIRGVTEKFMGDIQQIPPMYSALKHQGKRLYDLARQGIEVERKPRQIRVIRFDLIAHDEHELEFDIACSSGTYVRTLVDDLGCELGCGAHVTELRRKGVSPFKRPKMWTIMMLERLSSVQLIETLLPIDEVLPNWPKVSVPDNAADYIRQGQPVWIPGIKASGSVRLYQFDGTFIGLGEQLNNGQMTLRRLIALNRTIGVQKDNSEKKDSTNDG